MRAFDNFGGPIVTPDALNERIVGLSGIFGNEDVTGAAQIARCFAQRPAREQKFIAKWRLSINQHHVEAMFEMQILQTIVEQERIDAPSIDREPAALYPVFVHQHDHIF